MFGSVQALPAVCCGQEFANGAVSNYEYSSLYYYKGVPRNISPPWRNDDKDGHYVFTIGDNLTPHCKYSESICLHQHPLSPMKKRRRRSNKHRIVVAMWSFSFGCVCLSYIAWANEPVFCWLFMLRGLIRLPWYYHTPDVTFVYLMDKTHPHILFPRPTTNNQLYHSTILQFPSSVVWSIFLGCVSLSQVF